MTTQTQQLWICEECDSSTTPPRAIPTAASRTATAFDDIPAYGVCPACGVRRDEFSSYD